MTFQEVKELHEMGFTPEQITQLNLGSEPEPQPDNSTEPDIGAKGASDPSPEPSANDPDYEQLYNDLRSELDKVKNDLKVAQDANRKKPVDPNDPDPMADLADVFRSYM